MATDAYNAVAGDAGADDSSCLFDDAPLPTPVNGYERIKQLKQQLKQQGVKANIPDLLALSQGNDPFYAGSPGNIEQALWFVEQLNWLGLNVPGVHLRHVHYRLMSQDPPRMLWTGQTYINDKKSWQALTSASKPARYLGLVDVETFDDHRNPDPLIVMKRNEYESPRDPEWSIATDEWGKWPLPEIQVELADDLNWKIPEPEVSGYDYSPADQPFIVEIWIEKSGSEKVLLPLCRRWSVNYVQGIGFQSITGAINALKRLRDFAQHGNAKSLRIYYISDFDPGGLFMPDGTARQIEYWLEQYVPGADIRLTPLALTYEQVQALKLPTSPIKSTDKRMKKFCQRWGVDGAVELDAMEALHPGVLARIVIDAIKPYRDETLNQRLGDAEEEAVEAVEAAWNPHKREFNGRLEKMKLQAKEILESFRQQLETLSEQLTQAFSEAGIEEDLAQLRADVRKAADEFEFDELPERPEPEVVGNDEKYWLFDSRREYRAQLAFYKERRNGDDDDDGEDAE